MAELMRFPEMNSLLGVLVVQVKPKHGFQDRGDEEVDGSTDHCSGYPDTYVLTIPSPSTLQQPSLPSSYTAGNVKLSIKWLGEARSRDVFTPKQIAVVWGDTPGARIKEIIDGMSSLDLTYQDQVTEETDVLCVTQEQYDGIHPEVTQAQSWKTSIVSMEWLKTSIKKQELMLVQYYDLTGIYEEPSDELNGCIICLTESYPYLRHAEVRACIERLGGKYSRFVDDDVTHVSVSGTDCLNWVPFVREAFERNRNGEKVAVVSHQWLAACLAEREHKDESTYRVQNLQPAEMGLGHDGEVKVIENEDSPGAHEYGNESSSEVSSDEEVKDAQI